MIKELKNKTLILATQGEILRGNNRGVHFHFHAG